MCVVRIKKGERNVTDDSEWFYDRRITERNGGRVTIIDVYSRQNAQDGEIESLVLFIEMTSEAYDEMAARKQVEAQDDQGSE